MSDVNNGHSRDINELPQEGSKPGLLPSHFILQGGEDYEDKIIVLPLELRRKKPIEVFHIVQEAMLEVKRNDPDEWNWTDILNRLAEMGISEVENNNAMYGPCWSEELY